MDVLGSYHAYGDGQFSHFLRLPGGGDDNRYFHQLLERHFEEVLLWVLFSGIDGTCQQRRNYGGADNSACRRGGGRAFPRKPRDFRLGMPKKMRRLARNQAVLAKIQSENALIVEGLAYEEPKTRRLAALLAAVHADRGCLLATDGVDHNLLRSGRNLPRTAIMNVRDLNAFDILRSRRLVFTRQAFETFRSTVAAAAGADQ